MHRRDFLRTLGVASAGALFPNKIMNPELNKEFKYIEKIVKHEFKRLPYHEYTKVYHSDISWKNISKGLDFSRVEVYKKTELIDVIATIKINPNFNKIMVFNDYDNKNTETPAKLIEEWQEITGASVMINNAQYMSDPHYFPCAPMLRRGKRIGPRFNKTVRGMLVAEPSDDSFRKANLLDFEYDSFDINNTVYTEGVQHWPVLLDRYGKIKVEESLWQANRTVVAKDHDNNILFCTTEGGYFTLFNFGRFLNDSNYRSDRGFNIHTAMNMDGGYEAKMVVKSDTLEYVTYGEFETRGPREDISIYGVKMRIPSVLGVFPR